MNQTEGHQKTYVEALLGSVYEPINLPWIPLRIMTPVS